jgi:hypothetical protein
LIRLLTLIIITIYFFGCEDNSSYKGYKVVLLNLFKTSYLWSDRVDSDIDLSNIYSPEQMVEELKYRPKDRWSFIVSKEQNRKILSQSGVGFGFAYKIIDGNFTILYTRTNSPAYVSGLKRGDIVLDIDGKNPLDVDLLSLIDLNKSINFRVFRENTLLDISIMPSRYDFNVSDSKVVKDNIGYFRLDSFGLDVVDEINRSFDFFKSQNIKDLIVDLRYNSGGLVVVASIFLDKLVTNFDNEVQFRLKWNNNYKKRDYIYRFESDENSLNLDRIVFLTTNTTASASEVVINALKPYLNVITIGDRTYGKPVGMEGIEDRKYIYYLVNFKIENSLGISDYFDGLAPTCKEIDDLNYSLGDIREAMLNSAIYFIESGSCRGD